MKWLTKKLKEDKDIVHPSLSYQYIYGRIKAYWDYNDAITIPKWEIPEHHRHWQWVKHFLKRNKDRLGKWVDAKLFSKRYALWFWDLERCLTVDRFTHGWARHKKQEDFI